MDVGPWNLKYYMADKIGNCIDLRKKKRFLDKWSVLNDVEAAMLAEENKEMIDKMFDSLGNESSNNMIENHRHIFSRPSCSSYLSSNAGYRHYIDAQRGNKTSVYVRVLTQVAGFSTLLDRLRIPPCVTIILYGSYVIVMSFHNPDAVIALVYATCKSERIQINEEQAHEQGANGAPTAGK